MGVGTNGSGGSFESGKAIAADVSGNIVVAGLFRAPLFIMVSDTLVGSGSTIDLFCAMNLSLHRNLFDNIPLIVNYFFDKY